LKSGAGDESVSRLKLFPFLDDETNRRQPSRLGCALIPWLERRRQTSLQKYAGRIEHSPARS
jgi:hypothetical protein